MQYNRKRTHDDADAADDGGRGKLRNTLAAVARRHPELRAAPDEATATSSAVESTLSVCEQERQTAITDETVRALSRTTLVDVQCCHLSSACDGGGGGGVAASALPRNERALLYTGEPLECLRNTIVRDAVERDPTMTKLQALALWSNCDEQLDILLHRAQHLYLAKSSSASAATTGATAPPAFVNSAEPAAYEVLAHRFQHWLGVVPGSALKALTEQVSREMPDALPAVRNQEAERRAAELESKKNTSFECFVSDARMCALLLDAYLYNDDEVAGALFRDARRHQIESECRGPSMDAERARRLLEFEQFMCARLDERRKQRAVALDPSARAPDVHRWSTLDVVDGEAARAADGSIVPARSGGPRSVADFVRLAKQPGDLTQSSDELLRSHCEAMLRSLIDVVNLTAKLVQVAPSDAVFGSGGGGGGGGAAAHPMDKMHALLRASDTADRVNESAILNYLELWTRAPSLSQADIDRQLFAHHRDDEFETLEQRLRELPATPEGIKLALVCGVEPQTTPLMRAVISVLENEKFRETELAAAEKTRLQQRIEEQRARAERLRRSSTPATAASVAAAAAAAAAGASAAADGSSSESTTSRSSAAGLLQIYETSARALPTYSRSVLQSFLRAPLPPPSTERPCFNGDACICMTLNISYPLTPTQGFVCREFRPNPTREALERESALPCLLCNRYMTTAQVMSYARSKARHTNALPLTLLQDHAVLVGENEYNHDVLLPITIDNNKFNGIVRPQVMYSATHYAQSTTQLGKHVLPCVIELKALDFRRRWDAAIAT